MFLYVLHVFFVLFYFSSCLLRENLICSVLVIDHLDYLLYFFLYFLSLPNANERLYIYIYIYIIYIYNLYIYIYISDTTRNQTHSLFRPKREPIPLGNSVAFTIYILRHLI